MVEIKAKVNTERVDWSKFGGSVTPVLTPYHQDGSVDVDSLRKLVIHVIIGGTSVLFAGSNAGDGRLQNANEYKQSVRTIIEERDRNNPNIPVIAGVLKRTPEEITEFATFAKGLGADALVVAPMYGDGNPIDKVRAALEIGLPVILYDNPGFTDEKKLEISTIREIVDTFGSKVKGIKVTNKDIEYFGQVLQLRYKDFKVFQGNTAYAANSIKEGAAGMVAVESDINPYACSTLCNDSASGLPFEEASKAINNILYYRDCAKNDLKIGSEEIYKKLLVEKGIFETSYMHP